MHDSRTLRRPSDPSSTARTGKAERRSRLGRVLEHTAGLVVLLGATGALAGCTTHHWAQVESTELPPPPGPKVLHTGRVVVHVTRDTDETQCVQYKRYSPVCFHNIRPSLERGLVRTLWPTFPDAVVGKPSDVGPDDYLLQVEVLLDALPPDDSGPGWSAGARTRYRLIRDGKVVAEETLASRSRAVFPYGAPLGTGASEVVDATIVHIADHVSRVEESRPAAATPLPAVAARSVDTRKAPDTSAGQGPENVGAEARAKTGQPAEGKDSSEGSTPPNSNESSGNATPSGAGAASDSSSGAASADATAPAAAEASGAEPLGSSN